MAKVVLTKKQQKACFNDVVGYIKAGDITGTMKVDGEVDTHEAQEIAGQKLTAKILKAAVRELKHVKYELVE